MHQISKLQDWLFCANMPAHTNAFTLRPWRERIRFALAVFFLFATVGTIAIFINHTSEPMPLVYVLATMLASGMFAGVFVLIFGRLLWMLSWIGLFVATMVCLGQWGTILQKEAHEQWLRDNPASARVETRNAVEAYRNHVRGATLRDALLTLGMIVLSYISFIQAFNHEWQKRSVVESELQVARRIQESLLPPASKQIAGWHMHGMLQAASTVAGDYFDYLDFNDGKCGVLVADGSGHGVAAGLVMTMLKSQLYSLAHEAHDTVIFFDRLNQCVRALAPKNMFVTAAYVALTPIAETAAQIEYVTIGHPPLLHYSAARGTIAELNTPATALGLQATLRVKPSALTLEPNDVLLLYTDGVCEQMNARQEQWGLERLKAALREHQHLPLPQLCQSLVRAGAAFRENTTAHDDMTLVAIRCVA